jgi:hypothetical protein
MAENMNIYIVMFFNVQKFTENFLVIFFMQLSILVLYVCDDLCKNIYIASHGK